MTAAQLVVIAKAPVPGRVKTRLCPPCTPEQAAIIAGAALADTIAAGDRSTFVRRTLVLAGTYPCPPGWQVRPQRGDGLAERLVHAFEDTARPATSTVLIGMDTPQIDSRLLDIVASGLMLAPAVLAPAADGGWWSLALRDPAYATALRGVPMSRSDTYARTREALSRVGLSVASAPVLRDVDTAADALEVANDCAAGQFAAAVRTHIVTTNRPQAAGLRFATLLARAHVAVRR